MDFDRGWDRAFDRLDGNLRHFLEVENQGQLVAQLCEQGTMDVLIFSLLGDFVLGPLDDDRAAAYPRQDIADACLEWVSTLEYQRHSSCIAANWITLTFILRKFLQGMQWSANGPQAAGYRLTEFEQMVLTEISERIPESSRGIIATQMFLARLMIAYNEVAAEPGDHWDRLAPLINENTDLWLTAPERMGSIIECICWLVSRYWIFAILIGKRFPAFAHLELRKMLVRFRSYVKSDDLPFDLMGQRAGTVYGAYGHEHSPGLEQYRWRDDHDPGDVFSEWAEAFCRVTAEIGTIANLGERENMGRALRRYYDSWLVELLAVTHGKISVRDLAGWPVAFRLKFWEALDRVKTVRIPASMGIVLQFRRSQRDVFTPEEDAILGSFIRIAVSDNVFGL